jgi:hypothetical protein
MMETIIGTPIQASHAVPFVHRSIPPRDNPAQARGRTVRVHGIELLASEVDVSIMHSHKAQYDRICLSGDANADAAHLNRIDSRLHTKLCEDRTGANGEPVNYLDAWDHAKKAVALNPKNGKAAYAMAYLWNTDPKYRNTSEAIQWLAYAAHLGDKQALETYKR